MLAYGVAVFAYEGVAEPMLSMHADSAGITWESAAPMCDYLLAIWSLAGCP